MSYLLYGTDSYFRQKKLNELIDDINRNSISRFVFDQINLDFIIDSCATDSLLSNKQAIIIDDCFLFLSKESGDYNLKRFEAYLQNPNPNTVLIFNLNEEKIDQRKKITKLIEKYGIILTFEKEINVIDHAKNLFEHYHIHNNDLNYFLQLVGNNMGIIENEIKKLKDYKNEKLEITKEDIDLVVLKNQQPDLFKLIDAIVNQDVSQAIELYNVILIYNEEPIKLIVLLANQIRLIYQTKKLIEMGYDVKTIAKKLNVHPYRIKLAHEKGFSYQASELTQLLMKLADLDISIKKGLINKEIAFELFLLELNANN